jgi:uncharacterized protein (TIGR03083 family)
VDQLRSIDADSARIAEIALSVGGDPAVPACPGWTVLDLVHHLGEVHEFWARTVLDAEPAHGWEGDRSQPPAEVTSAVSWMREQTDLLREALSARGLSSPCWTWWGEPRTAGAVQRHQVQEAALHRWDAEGVLGTPPDIDPAVAADGIPEWIEVRLPWMTELPRPIVDLHATDVAGQWVLPSHDPACTTRVLVEGRASDLVLFVNGRRPLDLLRVTGDRDLLHPLISQMVALNN